MKQLTIMFSCAMPMSHTNCIVLICFCLFINTSRVTGCKDHLSEMVCTNPAYLC